MPATVRDAPGRALRESETLRQLVEAISSELELRPLLTRIVAHACGLLDADDGSIGLYDPMKRVIRTEAIHRMPPGELGAENAAGSGLAGAVLATGEPVLADRYADLPNMTLPELAANSVIGLPIRYRGSLLGFFGIGARPPRRFDAHDLATLQLFARHAAIAIDNAMRFRREQSRTERMALIARVSRLVSAGMEPEELTVTAAQVIHEQLGYPNVVIPLLERGEPDQLVFRARAGVYPEVFQEPYCLPVDQGIIGAAVRERAVQLVNDVHSDPRYVPPPRPIDVSCELAVPIVLGHEVFGVVDIEGRDPFDDDDVSSIQVIADHLAVAIKNAHLFDEARQAAVMRERHRFARDLHDAVSQALSSISLISQSLVPAWRKDAMEGERRAHRLEELSRLALAEMRALLYELQPVGSSMGAADLDAGAGAIDGVRRHGLRRALQNLAAVLAPETTNVRLDFDGYRAQTLPHEEALFRICQEALANAVRHGDAHTIVLRGEVTEASLVRIEVRDDGCGFDTLAPRRRRRGDGQGGFGLAGMRERAHGLGGSLRVESEPGAGTTVTVELPGRAR
jgi:signal transduction histidine kinase